MTRPGWLTERRTDDDLTTLCEQLRVQREAYAEDDAEGCAEADVAFHEAVVAHNRVFEDL